MRVRNLVNIVRENAFSSASHMRMLSASKGDGFTFINETSESKVVAQIGGSFSPPTYAHCDLIETICEMGVSTVEIAPVYHINHKSTAEDSRDTYDHRVAMTELAVKYVIDMLDAKGLNVNISVDASKASSTLYSLAQFSQKHPNHNKVFVGGSDTFNSFSLPVGTKGAWKGGNKKYLNHANFLVLPRKGYDIASSDFLSKHGIEDMQEFFKTKNGYVHIVKGSDKVSSDLSSTKVRNHCDTHNPELRGLVPDSVALYIKQNNLYSVNDVPVNPFVVTPEKTSIVKYGHQFFDQNISYSEWLAEMDKNSRGLKAAIGDLRKEFKHN